MYSAPRRLKIIRGRTWAIKNRIYCEKWQLKNEPAKVKEISEEAAHKAIQKFNERKMTKFMIFVKVTNLKNIEVTNLKNIKVMSVKLIHLSPNPKTPPCLLTWSP